ncbi:MAG: hypothetical protein ISR65_03790 [Bacteriovoracaceae bacterium]|nr:hypothetical protein [Bacteriovoracaceae bacterium]
MGKTIIMAGLLSLVYLQCAVASEPTTYGVTIIEISTSKKTMKVDVGDLRGIKRGDLAKFIIQKETKTGPVLQSVASGEAVRVHSTFSYWLIRQIDKPKVLVRGGRLVMIHQGQFLKGRRGIRVLNKKVVNLKGKDIGDYLQQREDGMDASLIHVDDKYEPGKRRVFQKTNRYRDVESIKFNWWELDNLDNDKSKFKDVARKVTGNVQLNKKESAKARKMAEDEVFKSSVENGIARTNKIVFSPEGEYIDFREVDKERSRIDPGTIAKIRQDGFLWSSDLDDETLKRYVVESGIVEEKIKQTYALGNDLGNEFHLFYNLGMIRNSTPDDQNNQIIPMAFGISYEYHLGRTLKFLERWTLKFAYSVGLASYNVGGVNARAVETSYKGFLHWYFYNTPATLNKYSFFLGLGIMMGTANLTSDKFTVLDYRAKSRYQYQVSAIPSFHLGSKYRFYNGKKFIDGEYVNLEYGLMALVTYQSKRLSVNESQSEFIYGIIDAYDLEFTVGVSIYF